MPEHLLPSADVTLGRRALGGLVAAAAALTLTGCTEDGTSGPVLPVDPVADPDVALAAEAWSAEMALLRRVRATRRRHPRLRPRLDGAGRAHTAHTDVLAQAVPTEELPETTPVPAPPGQPAAALRALARAEDTLARAQAQRAVRARSGALARVLAGTAAAAAQQSRHLQGDA